MIEALMSSQQLAQFASGFPRQIAEAFRGPSQLHTARVEGAFGSHGVAPGPQDDGVVDEKPFRTMLQEAQSRAEILFDDERKRANQWFLLLSIAVLAGLAAILAGAAVSVYGEAVSGGMASTSGVVVEAIGALFFRNWIVIQRDLKVTEASLAAIGAAELTLRAAGHITDPAVRDELIADMVNTINRISTGAGAG